VKAIIMAGGEGTRLRPLTCHLPKPLVPVLNRPVMEYTVELLKKHGITEIGVTLQYLPQEIKDWFGDGEKWGVSLKYFTETKPLGTAGSVKNAESFLDDTFIVISGDALTDLELQQAIDFHRQRKALVTIVLTSVANPLEYGVVLTRPDGRIERFLEKPGWGEAFSDQVNTGIYLLEPEIFQFIPRDKQYDFSKDLFPFLLSRNLPIFGCLLKGYWCDIGNLSQYLQANYDFLSGKVALTIQGTYQGDGIWLGPGVKLQPGVKIKGPVYIGANVELEDNVVLDSYSVLGDNCKVGEGTVIKKTVLWNNVYLGKKVDLRGSVICNGVILKNNCQVYEGAAIGCQTLVGEDSVIKPEVKIWPAKHVEQGVVLAEDLVWGTKANKYLFGSQGVYGVANRDITPEFAAKLGAAYGTLHAPQTKIVVSSDCYKASKMLKSALISGLVSTGLQVYDLGTVVMPVHRFAVRSLGVGGGIHLKVDADEQEKIWFQFVDGNGIDLGQGDSRKIENLFSRGDFRRADESQVGSIIYVPRFRESYQDYLMQSVDTVAIQQQRFRVVLDYDQKNLASIVLELFAKLAVKVVDFDSTVEHSFKSFKRFTATSSYLAEEVLRQQAHFGVILDANGEKVLLLDDQGNVIDESRLLLLYALIILKTSPGASVVVPVTVPQVIERLAEEHGGEVIRTKVSNRDLLESVYRQELLNRQGRFNQTVYFDGLLMLLKIMEYLAVNRTKLSELNRLLPRYHMCTDQEYCSWEKKGQVMRRLIEEHQADNIELLDGLKVKREDGWVLVLPDIEKPQYRIISEGVSQEVAEELTNFYKAKIRNLQL